MGLGSLPVTGIADPHAEGQRMMPELSKGVSVGSTQTVPTFCEHKLFPW